MHIDHSKLIDLLTEASGLEKEKVEKYLEDLVDEIKEAITEGEAYEVDGFGIFNGMGDNLIFIPDKDLETEINYKYAGMEPIELESPADIQEEPQEPEPREEDEYEDPFAFIYKDEDAETSEQENDIPEETAPAAEADQEPTSIEDVADEAEDDEIFADAKEKMEPEHKPGAEEWGIDSYKDEDSENVFSGLLGDSVDDYMDEDDLVAESEEEAKSEESEEDMEDLDIELELLASEETEEETESDLEAASIEEETDEFDDPFADLINDEEEQEEEEVIPVITNVSSKKKDIIEEEPEKVIKNPGRPKKRSPSGKKASPALLILIIILLLAGGAAALGYFGIINIPGITPQVASNQPTQQTIPEPETQTPVQQESETTPEDLTSDETNQEENGLLADDTPQEAQPDETAVDAGEQETEVLVPKTNMEPPADQPMYGLEGVPVEAANDGYTIVLFSLSNENNALRQQRELTNAGYRTLIYSQSSPQYGTLWRVSIGQFETLTDAAIASDELGEPYASNYFITQIK